MEIEVWVKSLPKNITSNVIVMSKLEWVGALQMLVKTGNGRNHFSLPHFMPPQIDKLGVGCTDRGKKQAETVLLVLAGRQNA